jgi:tRNA threonylcarbamoyladenosine biosynthesis protein TsaE
MKTLKDVKLEGLQSISKDIALSLLGDEIICLYGNLGAGKTTFTQFLGKELGIKKSILSPTFVIRSDYKGNKFDLYHFDWYRLNNKEELFDIGFYEVFGDGIIVIEWADKFNDIFDNIKTIDIYFEITGDNKRFIKIKNDYHN